MSDILNGIFRLKTSKPYIDYNNYHKDNIFGITATSRWELMHSNFIAWALPPDSSHALGFYPLYLFVRSLNKVESKADNLSARKLADVDPTLLYKFSNDNFIVSATIRREVAAPHKGTVKHIDLVLEIATKDKILPIIIENKVNSKENGNKGDQTIVYFNHAEKEYADTSKYYQPLYVYLYPKYNSKIQKSPHYIRMTYQELVNHIIEPSMYTCRNAFAVHNYKTYLQCLSFQSDSEKGGDTMAISSEEKQILEAFVDEHSDLLTAILTELDDIPEEVKKAVAKALGGRHSKYEFNGNMYNQRRLILAVVQKWAEDHPDAELIDFEAAFPQKISSHKIVRDVKDVKDLTRVFNEAPITTKSGATLVVNNQVSGDDMPPFIALADKLGYPITKM